MATREGVGDLIRRIDGSGVDEVALFAVDLDRCLQYFDCTPRDPRDAERAARFRFDVHRGRFLAGRLALRRVLADALGVRLEAVRLGEDALGKPCLVEPVEGLQFNVSHSGSAALIALSKVDPVGVDIELDAAVRDADGLAGQCLSASEMETWHRLPAQGRDRRFLDLWTRKEAALKAIGLGLNVSPATFSTGFGPAPTTIILAGRTVHVRSLVLDDAAHAAAVAVQCPSSRMPD